MTTDADTGSETRRRFEIEFVDAISRLNRQWVVASSESHAMAQVPGAVRVVSVIDIWD